MVNGILPPHDIAAEEAVVGSLLVDPDAILKIAAFLNPEDFFAETNQWVYQACFSLYQRTEVINQITVAHELMRQGKLEQIGGAAYLSHLISIVMLLPVQSTYPCKLIVVFPPAVEEVCSV